MAIYHFSVAVHSRSEGRSGVKGAAYRHGTRLKDTLINEWSHSYQDKVILSRGLCVPEGEKIMGLAQMWNMAEAAETRVNSVVAREVDLALPTELAPKSHIDLTKKMAKWLSDEYGIGVDWAIHGDDLKNPHAHLGMTTRRLEGGQFTTKTRELDNKKTGSIEFEKMRAHWARIVNIEMDYQGLDERIDHRSYERQGINKTPGKHMGPQSSKHLAHLAEKAQEVAEAVVVSARSEVAKAQRIRRITANRSATQKSIAEKQVAHTRKTGRGFSI